MKIIERERYLTLHYLPPDWQYLGSLFDGLVEVLAYPEDNTLFAVWKKDSWWLTFQDDDGILMWDTTIHYDYHNVPWSKQEDNCLTTLKRAAYALAMQKGAPRPKEAPPCES